MQFSLPRLTSEDHHTFFSSKQQNCHSDNMQQLYFYRTRCASTKISWFVEDHSVQTLQIINLGSFRTEKARAIIYTYKDFATYGETAFNYCSNRSKNKAGIIKLVPFDLAETLRPQLLGPFPLDFAHRKMIEMNFFSDELCAYFWVRNIDFKHLFQAFSFLRRHRFSLEPTI